MQLHPVLSTQALQGGFLKRGAVVVSDERRRRGHGEPTSIFSIFKTNAEQDKNIFDYPIRLLAKIGSRSHMLHGVVSKVEEQ